MNKQNFRLENEMYHLTIDEMLELLKCAKDPVYFIENYYYTTNATGETLLKLRDYQKIWISNLHDAVVHNTIKHNYILNAARQLGKTTIISAYLLWYAIFNQNKKIWITSCKEVCAVTILDSIKKAILNLPTWLQPAIALEPGKKPVTNNTIKFAGGTIIVAKTLISYPRAIHPEAPDFIFADEFSFSDPAEQTEFMQCVFPTVAGRKESHVVLASTGGDIDDPFIKILEKAKLGENSFVFDETAANDVEYYTKDDLKKMINQFGMEFVLKEFFLNNN